MPDAPEQPSGELMEQLIKMLEKTDQLVEKVSYLDRTITIVNQVVNVLIARHPDVPAGANGDG